MSMRSYKQLREDLIKDLEFAKKLEEPYAQLRKSGDKAEFIKTLAGLGYEVTEQDLDGSYAFVKLDDDELDSVAGGFLNFGAKEENGREMGCGCCYYVQREDLPKICPGNSSGQHCFEESSETIPCQRVFGDNTKTVYVCKYCKGWTFIAY